MTNHLSAMPMASSSHYSNNTRNYSTPGSLGFHTRSQGTTDINQTSLPSKGALPVGCGVYGNESNRASQAGLIQYSGNFHANANGYHYGNGVNGSMVSTSLPSKVAQPVQQAMPNTGLFPSNMMRTMDNPNPIRQQEFPEISRLRYNGKTGGISLSPWPVPVDDDGDRLRNDLGENEVMQNTATTGMAQGTHGHGSAGQTSASQAQDLTGYFSWESTTGNGTTSTSGGTGVVTDGAMECDLNEDDIERFFGY